MIESPDRLTNLAAAVADGRPTDWDSAESSASDETERALIARLRAIEAIGRLGSLHSLTSTAGLVEPPPFHEPQTAAHVASLRTWGPLRLLERIARGRFGDVYRAWDPRLDRPVALKLLRRRDDDGTDESLIVEEGRLMARVRHPNVVTIFGAERIDGRTGLWMEFIDGRTLEAELAERGPLTSDEVSRVGVELCRALAAVHDAGLVHRDVKAQNVLRESGGRIVLGDFGTGRELDEDADRSSGIAGTPAYLAPEIFRAAPATPQSDLYSLGVLLFHLATGQYPVQGRSLREIRDAHAFGRRRSIRTLCANLPAALLETIERALDAEPTRRFESARAMEAALSAAVTPVADRSRGSSDTPRLRAGRVTSAMIGALVLSAGIGVVVWRDRLNSVVERRDSGDAEQATEDTRTVSKPSLTFNAGDWVVVANVDNQTGVPLLDGVVEAAVKRELEFSDYIHVAQRGRVDDTLRALGRPLDTRLDRSLAQEISLRDGGVRAYIAGGIAKAGGTYEIALDVVNPASQTTIATLTDRAPRQADILAALRRQTLRIRETLGEPPASVDRSRQVFQQMPLPKLKALKLYAESWEVDQRPGTPSDHNEAIRQMMREAIREDPTFALLYFNLSGANIGEGGRADEILANSERAFQLAATATPQERYRITAGFHHMRANRNNRPGHGGGEEDPQVLAQAVSAYEALFALQPDDDGVMVLLRNCYRELGRERDTAWMYLRLADARPRNVGANFEVARQLVRDGNLEGARRYALRAELAVPPASAGSTSEWGTSVRLFGAYLSWLQDDPREMLRALDRIAATTSGLPDAERRQLHIGLWGYYAAIGRLKQAERIIDAVRRTDGQDVAETLVEDVQKAEFFEESGQMTRLRELVAARWRTPLAPGAPDRMAARTGYLIDAGFLEDAERDLEWYRGRGWAWSLPFLVPALDLARGRPEAAVPAFQQALETALHSDLSVAYQAAASGMATALESLGKPSEAIDVLKKAGEHRRDLTTRWLRGRAQLARLYRKNGLDAEARAVEAQLLKLLALADSDHPLLRELRARQ